MHIDSRKITLPKPQRGDIIGKPGMGGYTYYVYDGTWEKDRRKGEKEVTITESLSPLATT